MEWYKEAGGVYKNKNTKAFTRNIFIKPNEIPSIIERFNHEDVYTTPYYYSSKIRANALLYAPFYLDLDLDVSKQEDYNKVRIDALSVLSIFENDFKIPLKYIKIYYSGNKGFHFFINPVLLGILPSKTLNEDFKYLAKKIKSFTLNKTIDTVIYDAVRLMRLPNTINSKSGLYKVRITKHMLETFTVDQIRLYASKPRLDPQLPMVHILPEARRKYLAYIQEQKDEEELQYKKSYNNIQQKNFSAILPCVAYILDNGAPTGSRNNTAVAVASSLFQCGGNVEDVTDLLIDWNRSKNDNSKNAMTNNEIKKTVESSYRRYQNNMYYGCSTFRDLGFCLGKLCKLYKGDH